MFHPFGIKLVHFWIAFENPAQHVSYLEGGSEIFAVVLPGMLADVSVEVPALIFPIDKMGAVERSKIVQSLGSPREQ